MKGAQDAEGARSEYEPGAALCLSGGGYRAMLFHAGGLLRLNELGWLPRLRHVAGVSGGAILAGWLGLKWHELEFMDGESSDPGSGDASAGDTASNRGGGASRPGGGADGSQGVALNLRDVVLEPLYELAGRPLDIAAGLAGMFIPASVLARGLDSQLFRGALLGDLPRGRSATGEADGAGAPLFAVYATNLLTGAYTELSAMGVSEEHLGRHVTPELHLSSAVAASCTIPPTFRPFRLRLDPAGWRGECLRQFAHVRKTRTPLRLCDGGNHDNLGLKAVWDRYETLLVSDGSSPMPPWRWISGNWLATTLRSNRILIDQIRDMKKRILIHHKFAVGSAQDGAYWGIASSADGYGLPGAMVRDSELTNGLANMRTRLGRHTVKERRQLVNFGYAMADTALRRHVPPDAAPGHWPYPEYAL
ncbi:MAG TPA: patatin-like phospholipase family protein [Firmicutes bacterium]|nr:patatin-like phospholipase family protein [Bacillota bacterium]